jgi:hypothetical protein
MKSPLTQLTVSIILCVAAVVGYGVWYATISAKSTAVAKLESSILAKTEAANRIAAARTMLAGIANNDEIVRGYFVPETGVVAFIDALEAQGKEQGAAVSVLSVSTEGTAAQPSFALSLAVKGTFEAVMRTVGAIEYVPYNLSISALAVTQDAKNLWHADLTLRVGSVPPANGAANASPSSPAVASSTSLSYAPF